MGFMESYKLLDRLCADALGEERGIPAYIDAMRADPRDAYYIEGWDEDLKQLNHYRWLRNRIAHDPGCTEENRTASGDVQWLETFRARMLEQTDPLAVYHKARRPVSAGRVPVRNQTDDEAKNTLCQRKTFGFWAIGLVLAVLGVLILAGMILPELLEIFD